MIKVSLKSDVQVLKGLSNYAARYSDRVYANAETAYNSLEGILLETLQDYPPPPPTSTYIRTYRLRDGWTASIAREGSGFVIIVANDTPYAKYVVGSFAKARAAAAKLQAWMHKGRWPLATDTLTAFDQLFQEAFSDLQNAELSNYGVVTSTRRAYTR